MESLVMNRDLNFWENRKVFITGHSGFKGAWLVQILKKFGAEIYGFSLDSEPSNSIFKELYLSNKYCRNNYFFDINNFNQLKDSIQKSNPDIIFHLAAQSLVRKSYKDPLDTWNTNLIGTLNLLEAAKTLNKRVAIVVITTDKVYQNNERSYSYDEEDKLGGFDPYSASKAAVEIAVKSWRDSFCGKGKYQSENLSIATARAGNVIGGGDWSEDRLVPDSIRALIKNNPIRIRNPKSTRPWQHVLEPLDGYMQLAHKLFLNDNSINLQNSNLFEQAFNFGPKLDSNKEVKIFVEELLKIWHGKWIDISHEEAPHEANLLNLKSEKAKMLLNWESRWDFEKTLSRTINWYKKDFEGQNPLKCCEDDIEEFFDYS